VSARSKNKFETSASLQSGRDPGSSLVDQQPGDLGRRLAVMTGRGPAGLDKNEPIYCPKCSAVFRLKSEQMKGLAPGRKPVRD
jgi:hypothetical protein